MPLRRLIASAGLAALLVAALPAAAPAAGGSPSAASLGLESTGSRTLLAECPIAVRLTATRARASRDGVVLRARRLADGDRRYAFTVPADAQYCGIDVRRGGENTRPRAKLRTTRSGTYTDLRAGTPQQAQAVVVFARPRALPSTAGLPRDIASATPLTSAKPAGVARFEDACPFALTVEEGPELPKARRSLVGAARLTTAAGVNTFAFVPSDRGELCGAVATYSTDDRESIFFPPLDDGTFVTPASTIDAAGRASGVVRVTFYARRVYDQRP